MKSTFPDFGIDFFIILATFAIGRNRSYKYIHTHCTTTTQQCKQFLSFPYLNTSQDAIKMPRECEIVSALLWMGRHDQCDTRHASKTQCYIHLWVNWPEKAISNYTPQKYGIVYVYQLLCNINTL